MNRPIFLLVLMLAAAHASVIYTVDTDRSGSSSVSLSIEGSETVNVSLPGDAGSFRIVGGSYSLSGNSAIVKSGASGLTTFSFSTSDFTSKLSTGWKLSFSAPEGSTARVSMPSRVTIENMFPAPKTVSAEDSRTSIDFENPGPVTIYYRLEDAASSPPDNSALYILAAAALVAIGIVAASFVLKRPPVPAPPPAAPASITPAPAAEKQPSLDLTPGKKEMMETFNENDLVIVNFLLSVQGKSRRNELERKSGVSKSSLAMALNRLEKRKIVEIDRTSTTHFVKLSDYFLKL
ncbi:MAG TPA: hypothetical protein VLD37_01390 [Candidatus Bilamarchaeum sp.]|nr:hypothetical protein [Candidatus Bilamarchaeum sp.]